VGRRAEAFLADPANDEAVVRRLFTLRLAHLPEAGDAVRRPARRTECSAAEWGVAEQLADQEMRLLTLARAADGEPLAEVAHEQLLRRWPRLKSWLDEEREFLVWKGQVEHAAAVSAILPEAERDGALLMGRPLEIAQGWLERRGEDLAFEVRAFLERSISRRDTLQAERVETERRLNESELNREREARDRAEEAQRAALRLAGRTRVGALVVSILFVIAAAVGAYAVSAERTAQDELRQTQIAQSRLLAAQSQQQLEAGNGGTALALALEALPTDTDKPERPDIPEAEGAAFGALLGLTELTMLSGHEDALQDAAFSPDGTRVVTASDDGTARIWDAVTGKEIMRLQAHKGVVPSVAFSPDGKVIATAAGKTVLLWDAATGSELAQFAHEKVLKSVRFSRDGRLIVTASKGGVASIWDVAARKVVATYKTCSGDPCSNADTDELKYAELSFDGRLLVTASHTGVIRVWSVATSEQVAQFACDGIAWQATFSPDGKTVVGACGRGPAARIWDLETRKEIATFSQQDGLSSVAFSADGRRLVTGSFDASARVWDVAAKAEIAVLRGHSSGVMSASFSLNGDRVVTASYDKTARIWKATSAQDVVTMRGHEGTVTGVDFDTDGSRVVTTSGDGSARIWDAASGRELMALPAAKSGYFVRRAVFSLDGTRIATASSDGTARIWDAKSGTQILELAHDQPLWRVRFDAVGSRVITAAEDGTAHIWDMQTGKELRVLRGAARRMYDAVFDREGTLVILASEGGTTVWDASTGERKVALRGDVFSYGAEFSRDGKRLVTAGADGMVIIWDAASGQMLMPLIGHQGQVLAAAFSPDDRRVVSASLDRTARIWDTETGHEIFRVKASDRLYDAIFSPDGRRIVVASADETATVWPVPDGAPGSVIDPALSRAPRCLAPEERARFFLGPASPEWCRRLAKWPYDASSYEVRGHQLRRDRAYAEAIVAFNEALRLDPSRQPQIASDLASSYNGTAWTQFENAEYAEGLNNANHAVELAPDNWAILDTRGQIFFALGKYDDAFSDLSKSIDNGAEDPITFYTLGRIYERRGQREPAIADYRKAVELEAHGVDTNKRAQERAHERLTALGALTEKGK
jgi:WD40 repeat protein/Flp pilus assembly protein TadD